LGGAPDVYVTDGGRAVIGATGTVWPAAAARRCEYHLTRNLRDALPSQVARDLEDPLHAALRGAVSSLSAWKDFRHDLNARGAKEPGFMNSMTLAARLDPVVQA
jgi:transposase-like protein